MRVNAQNAILLIHALSLISLGAQTGTIRDVRHVVILAQENRSFDQYYGCLGGVRGFADANAVQLRTGRSALWQLSGTNFVLPFHATNQCLADVNHDRSAELWAWNHGGWDNWILSKGPGAVAFFDRSDLGFYYQLAQAYTICDAYHCSVFGPTGPNRLCLMSGMVDPNGTGGGPVLTNGSPAGGFTWTTYPERLESRGVSWRVYEPTNNMPILNALNLFSQYMQAVPGQPLYERGVKKVPDIVAAFAADVTNHALPQVAWLIPPLALSEHAPGSPATGQALVAQLLQVLASEPAIFNTTVFILTYDEAGGFFDHVPPPVPGPGIPDEWVAGWPIGLGVRVPLLIISPWTRGGFVCSEIFDHTSIIRFLERWTGVYEPNISAWRRQLCGDLTSAFDFTHPNTNFPNLPPVTPVVCTNAFVPVVPEPQVLPAQEPGTLAARALPYQPNAVSALDPGGSRVWILMTNSGSASVHCAIYANAFRADGPWHYDVPAGSQVAESFVVTNAALGYDFTCYGPNGFHRRFAGRLGTNGPLPDAALELDPDGAAVSVLLRNPGTNSAFFTVSNANAPALTESFEVPPGTTFTQNHPVRSNGCCYALAVTLDADINFLRRFAGKIELGCPVLKTRMASGTWELTYPAWAEAYDLEFTTNLASGSWALASALPVQTNGGYSVNMPMDSNPAFYRLRHR